MFDVIMGETEITNDKERTEGRRAEVFIELFNKRYGTDYKLGPPENENSIVDRRAVSDKHENLLIQLKEVKKLDRSYFIESIFGRGVKVFDSNIFVLLPKFLPKIIRKYGDSAEGIVLVLSVGVSEEWLNDYSVPEEIKSSKFKGIYCLGLPSSDNPEGFIVSLKSIYNE